MCVCVCDTKKFVCVCVCVHMPQVTGGVGAGREREGREGVKSEEPSDSSSTLAVTRRLLDLLNESS